MPIVETAVGPLRQGDILKSLVFYTTSENRALPEERIPYSVVISRDCKALRSDTILVAEIHAYNDPKDTFKEIFSSATSFDEARRTFDALRDGDGRPDECYLGPLLGGEERFAVALDRIHSVAVPVGDARDVWVASHRACRLTSDFIRHLQVRLFSSIVKQGFDDHGWWPTQDLDALVLVGQRELDNLSAAISSAELDIKGVMVAAAKQQDMKAAAAKQQEIKNRQATLKNDKEKFESLKKALQPYQDELKRRSTDGGS